jgi:hypothetical protein
MGSLSNLQRNGILKFLRNNKKCTVRVLYATGCTKELTYAEDFASVLREAGWTVSGPEPSESISAEGVQIGALDLSAHGIGAHLLLDTLTAVGITATLRPTKDLFPKDRSTNCLLIDTEG